MLNQIPGPYVAFFYMKGSEETNPETEVYHWLERGTGWGNGTPDGAGGLMTSSTVDSGGGRPALLSILKPLDCVLLMGEL